MDSEASRAAAGGRAARARRFAALGDPARLAVVEELALGDAAPGELGRRLELASNLLAHHLNVLTGAGLVRRVRSEGDRRRSYVRLLLDDPDVAALAPALALPAAQLVGPGGAPTRVVFVCTHNSARSQLAAAVWGAASDLPVASAGTHPAQRVHPRAVATARRHGLRLTGAGTRRLDETVRRGDLLVAVCDNAYEELAVDGPADRPGPAPVRLHWSIPDPVPVGDDEAFEAAFGDIAGRVARLARGLAPGC
jgi:protein-tyrosine-phosphatase/DNA-binding transcriptional ArsR family regulator